MRLPRDVRAALEAAMVERGFGGYRELSAWLDEQGHRIGPSALSRHGQILARRIEQVRLATEHAEALVAAAPDDTGALADAGIRLAQERLFEVLLAAESGDLKETAAAARALAETARAGTLVRTERRRVLAEAAQAADRAGRAAGLSTDAAAAIRAAIEGAAA